MNPESGVYDLIGKWAALQPRSAAVSAPGGTWIDYGGLKYEVDEIGKTLGALGIRTSDRVAVMLPNGLEMAIALLGVSAWAASAPLNAQSSLDELDFYFADLKPRAVIVPPGVPANVRAVAADHRATLMTVRPCGPVAPFELAGQGSEGKPLPKPGRSEAIALVLHTSGTTSRAKLVPLSHRNLLASARNTALALQLTPQDRCLNLMPLFHTHGIIGALLSSMTAGASIVCTPGFQAENVLRWLGDCEPTWYTGVPAMHEAILNDLENRTDVLRRLKLRFVRTSSAPLRPSLLARLETVMHVPVFDSYGLTEASQLTSNPLPPYTQKPGSVGLPSGPEIVVVDANGTALPPGARGEVVVRGANVIAGYASDAHNRDSFRDGWLRTGDEGYFDSDGYLFLTGRLKEIINRGGEKICPREIDEVLLEHADVTEAAAFGIPHPSLGEDIAAAVVLKPGACQDERALLRFVEGRLPVFKVPRLFVFVTDLPKGPTGKVLRVGLAEKLDIATAIRKQNSGAGPDRGTDLQQTLTDIWTETLGTRPAGMHENFFLAGGDSIRLTQFLARVHRATGIRVSMKRFFGEPTIAALAGIIERRNYVAHARKESKIHRRRSSRAFPLSYGQQRLWFLERLLPGTCVYNVPVLLRFKGELHFPSLERALGEVLNRHEILGATFVSVQGRPTQVVGCRGTTPIAIVDCSVSGENDRECQAIQLAALLAREPLDLSSGPLVRATLLRISDDDHFLLLNIHHIVCDEWSIGIFIRELLELYESLRTGGTASVRPLPAQYVDYITWQKRRAARQTRSQDLSYWIRELARYLPAAELPIDKPRPETSSHQGAHQTIEIPETKRLRALACQHGATFFISALAAFQLALSFNSGADSVVVGAPTSGRKQAEFEEVIGLFANTVVLGLAIRRSAAFPEVLAEVRSSVLDAYAHDDLPFEQLVKALQPRRDPRRMPLFQTWFSVQDSPMPETSIAGVTVSRAPLHTGAARYDLKAELVDYGHRCEARFEYDAELFHVETIQRLARDFRTVIALVISNPDLKIASIYEKLAQCRGEDLSNTNQQLRFLTREKLGRLQRTYVSLGS